MSLPQTHTRSESPLSALSQLPSVPESSFSNNLRTESDIIKVAAPGSSMPAVASSSKTESETNRVEDPAAAGPVASRAPIRIKLRVTPPRRSGRISKPTAKAASSNYVENAVRGPVAQATIKNEVMDSSRVILPAKPPSSLEVPSTTRKSTRIIPPAKSIKSSASTSDIVKHSSRVFLPANPASSLAEGPNTARKSTRIVPPVKPTASSTSCSKALNTLSAGPSAGPSAAPNATSTTKSKSSDEVTESEEPAIKRRGRPTKRKPEEIKQEPEAKRAKKNRTDTIDLTDSSIAVTAVKPVASSSRSSKSQKNSSAAASTTNLKPSTEVQDSTKSAPKPRGRPSKRKVALDDTEAGPAAKKVQIQNPSEASSIVKSEPAPPRTTIRFKRPAESSSSAAQPAKKVRMDPVVAVLNDTSAPKLPAAPKAPSALKLAAAAKVPAAPKLPAPVPSAGTRCSSRAKKFSSKALEVFKTAGVAPPPQQHAELKFATQGTGGWNEVTVVAGSEPEEAEHLDPAQIIPRIKKQVHTGPKKPLFVSRSHSVAEWKRIFASQRQSENEGNAKQRIPIEDDFSASNNRRPGFKAPTEYEELADNKKYLDSEMSGAHYPDRDRYFPARPAVEVTKTRKTKLTAAMLAAHRELAAGYHPSDLYHGEVPGDGGRETFLKYSRKATDHHSQAPESCVRGSFPEPEWKTRKYEEELVGELDNYSAPFKKFWAVDAKD